MNDIGPRVSDLPKVAILLGTFNGQEFLEELLDSLAWQSYANWEVWASDDGSVDDTLSILERYQHIWPKGRLKICSGPKRGFVANFLSLVCKNEVSAQYYAFADQDDIWEPEKLERAVQKLESQPSELPALYCARTRLIDSGNLEIGLSPLFSKPPSFANSLMQNIGGGNTMVFNEASRRLLRIGGYDVSVVTHDWWVYMVVAGCGGNVYYDRKPTLRYRQHGTNIIGGNSSWVDRLARLRLYWKGNFRNWNDKNISSLRRLRDNLTEDNREILDRFSNAREMDVLSRIVFLRTCGLYRQTWMGNLGLYAAVILNKL